MVNNLIKNKNIRKEIAALITVLLFVIILSLKYDFYFDLNDDVAIRDLLSGNYSGTPEAHCMQLLYPLGLVLSGLYRIMPVVPWFGSLLCVCQFVSLYGLIRIIKNQIKSDADRLKENTWLPVVLLIFFMGMLLREYIFLQYTVTAAILCVYVILDVILNNTQHIWFDTFIWLMAFCIRSEMGMLLLPFLGYGILASNGWSLKTILKKEWITFYAALLISLGMTWGIDCFAYNGEWKEFRDFFNARTTIYDYTGIPDYEDNKLFYEENNISKDQYQLLVSYNFGLDDDIDVSMMQILADYAKNSFPKTSMRRFYEACYTYVYDAIHGYEWGYYVLVMISYIFIFKLGMDKKHWNLIVSAVGLFTLRSGIWIYLYYAGRIGGLPARITHPLFLTEIIICIGLLIKNYREDKWKLSNTFCIITTYACISILLVIIQASDCSTEYMSREVVNSEWNTWSEYAREESEHFYFLDVYSVVKYSEKIFETNQSEYRNFDYAGGWISKSPACEKKYLRYGFNSPSSGIDAKIAIFVDDIGNENGNS